MTARSMFAMVGLVILAAASAGHAQPGNNKPLPPPPPAPVPVVPAAPETVILTDTPPAANKPPAATHLPPSHNSLHSKDSLPHFEPAHKEEKHKELLHKEEAHKEESKPGELLVQGEYLLLAPRRTGQTYGLTGTNPNFGPLGHLRSLDGNYDSGFRIGAGFTFGEELDVMARYTYFNTDANEGFTAPAGQTIFTTLTHPAVVTQANSVAAQNSTNFNLFDFEFGKRIEVGESVKLRVFAGPRYANVDQKLTVTYSGGDVARDNVARALAFDGAGLRAGGETQVNFLESLGIYVRGSASLLTGRFRANLMEVANTTPIVNVAENFNRVIPMLDLGIGLAFQKGSLRVAVGYEFMNWIGMVEHYDFVDDAHPGKMARSTGNLGFDGVVFRVELGF